MDKESQEDRAARVAREQHFDRIVRPLRDSLYQVDVMWNGLEKHFEGWARDYGGVDLNPDYQRGHVWSPEQQQHFIENVLRGAVSQAGLTVQMNCPNWNVYNYDGELPQGFQCIDGLQRLTAVREYIKGNVKPFGLSVEEFNNSQFSVRRGLFRLKMAVYDFTTRAEVLQHYLDLNAGGTPHTPEEIARVRTLKEAAEHATAAPTPKSAKPR